MTSVITLSSDFEKQSQGVANMEGVVFQINPSARVVHLHHGIEGFNLMSAARTMETVSFMPIGFHVCVVDPGVGTKRRGIIVQTGRGDFLIGPDNGCLMAAPRFLGGVNKVVEITNPKYMVNPVSPIFHGRHVFAPAAAHLSLGIQIEEFGQEIKVSDCIPAPYKESVVENSVIKAVAIHANKFGSLHLNILGNEWDKLGAKPGDKVTFMLAGEKILLPVANTFGEVPLGKPLIMKDDYGRVELAVNQGSFSQKFGMKVGQQVLIKK